jgi:hypothetical protein
MTAFEQFYAIATGSGPVLERTRRMIGEENLALMLAKATVSGTTIELSPTLVAKEFSITAPAAHKKIESITVPKHVN